MPVRPSMLRATALVTVAALVLHELRYMIGYGSDSHEALASQGHAYLPLAGALAGGALAVAGARFVARLLRPAAEERAPRLVKAWLYASVALLVIYACQESVEGAALASHDGVVVIPLALVLGGLVAFVLRGASRVLSAAVRRAHAVARRKPPTAPRPRLRAASSARAGLLALNLAGRAPPAVA
jgi:hypothetical protein